MRKPLKEMLKKIGGGHLLKEVATPKIIKMINDTMKYDSLGDLEDVIDSLNLDKKYWKVIDEYLNDMRDVEMGVQPKGYDNPARKNLPKILKKAVITKRK